MSNSRTTRNRASKTKPSAVPQAEQIAQLALQIAIEQRALDPAAIDLREITDIADYFVICSGTSERHISGIADRIINALAAEGEKPITVSGLERAEWVLIDYGDVVIHIFYEPTRQFYKLDDLWKDGPTLDLNPELEEQAKKLRTGMYLRP